MRFGEYLSKSGIRPIDAARDLDCSKSHVSNLIAGLADPSMALAREVQTWSKGAVTLADWPEPTARAA